MVTPKSWRPVNYIRQVNGVPVAPIATLVAHATALYVTFATLCSVTAPRIHSSGEGRRLRANIPFTCGVMAVVASCAIAAFGGGLVPRATPLQALAQRHTAIEITPPPRTLTLPASLAISEPRSASDVQPIQGMASETPGEFSGRQSAYSMRVTFVDNLLAIRADNAPLIDVLREVQRVTGASLELRSTLTERVSIDVARAPSEALRLLLDRVEYDYVVMASIGPSDRIERIILNSRVNSHPAVQMSNIPTIEQQQVISEERGSMPAMLDVAPGRDHQQRQFESVFGACVAQGCDAS